MNALVSAVLFMLQALVNARVQSRIRALALNFQNLPQQPGESRRDYNDRRKNLVVEAVKGFAPELRTALIEAVLALVVTQISPR